MTEAQIRQAAQILLDARAQRKPLTALPAECRPASAQDAYAVQDAVMAGLGPVGGWKVGASAHDGEPNCAPLPASGVMKSPVRLSSGDYPLRGIEAEIGYRFKRDLPPREQPYTLAEILDAVGSVHPIIELIESRYTDRTQVDTFSALADSLSHGGLIYGEGRDSGFAINQLEQAAELKFNDTTAFQGKGANPAGDVLRLLVWLANHGAHSQGGIRAGQIVTTGSCSGVTYADPGVTVSAHLPGLGWVEVNFC